MLLDQQNGKFYAVQKTISGRYADSIRSPVSYTHLDVYKRQENSMVRIEIADNGPGISDEAKQRLFDMFYTVNTGSAGADSRRGLGLGLSLCKSIVEAHGGSITVHDNQPHGSVDVYKRQVCVL